MATKINLREYYPWYEHDEITEVPDEVAAELRAGKRYERAHERRMRRNKSYSGDDAEIETAAMACQGDNPETIYGMMENHCRLCRALNSLPEKQGRRIEAYYLFGKSQTEIARAEGVEVHSVNESIKRGLRAMKKNILGNGESSPKICPESDLYI